VNKLNQIRQLIIYAICVITFLLALSWISYRDNNRSVELWYDKNNKSVVIDTIIKDTTKIEKVKIKWH